ncbi:MAG: 4Fe-4S dicluster-binding protein [Thermodesulfobacteriota bacterium]
MEANKKLPTGGDTAGGTAHDYETGGWRKLHPILDRDKCIDCLTCWVMCPDSAIIVEDDKMIGFDMQHCKGCGICADVCPDKVTAIVMEEEAT